MQDNLATGQKLGTHGLPLDLSDCSGARGTLYRDLGRELAQGQRLRAASLDYTRPLLPHHCGLWGLDEVLVLHVFRDVPLVERSLVGFHVLPGFTVPHLDVLLLLLDEILSDSTKLVLHVLDPLMVDVEQQVDGALRNLV